IATVFGSRLTHCQSQQSSVGNPARAPCFESLSNPSIHVRLGFIKRFQKIGEVVNAKSLEGFAGTPERNITFPPLARRAFASSHELETNTSAGVSVSVAEG